MESLTRGFQVSLWSLTNEARNAINTKGRIVSAGNCRGMMTASSEEELDALGADQQRVANLC